MRRSIRSIKRQMLALFLGLIILIMGLIFASTVDFSSSITFLIN